MSKRVLSLVLRITLCAGISLALAAPASAIPAFARKYGLRCTTCHNPHEPLQREITAYDARCAACHKSVVDSHVARAISGP